MLALNVEAYAARGHDLQGGAAGEERGDVRGGNEDVLAVVEDKERLLRLEGLLQDVSKEPVTWISDTYRFGQCRHDEAGVTNWRQVNEDHAIDEGRRCVVRDRQRESGLADTPGTGQREERNRLIEEQGSGRCTLALPANEAGTWDRERFLRPGGRHRHRDFPGCLAIADG